MAEVICVAQFGRICDDPTMCLLCAAIADVRHYADARESAPKVIAGIMDIVTHEQYGVPKNAGQNPVLFTIAMVQGFRYNAGFRKEVSRLAALDAPKDQVIAKAYKRELRHSSNQVEGFWNSENLFTKKPLHYWRHMSFTQWYDWGNEHYASWLDTLKIAELNGWGVEKRRTW